MTIPDLLIDEDEGKFTRTDQEKANTLNDKFASVFNPEETMYCKIIPDKTLTKILDIKIDEDMVKKKLLSFVYSVFWCSIAQTYCQWSYYYFIMV